MVGMKTRILLLVLATGVAIYAGIQYSGRISPEILQANEALRQARSWKADLVVHSRSGAGLWGAVRVVCPDRMDRSLRGAAFSHTIQIGDKTWTQDISFSNWTEVPNDDATPSPCRFGVDQPVLFANPVARAMAIAAEFDRALRHHLKFSRGAMTEVQGEACRNWTVDNAYMICLSEKEQLPLRYASLDGAVEATFSQWNWDFTIDEPHNEYKPYPSSPFPQPKLPEVPPYSPPKPDY
jgi:hypothetical protein